jgi:SpoOM protein
MFGRVKQWLGIEGVKVELDVPEKIGASDNTVDGTVRFYSLHDQTVKSVRIKLIEKYKRGRRMNKLVDEYTLGEIEMVQDIEVPAHEYVEVEFSLPFSRSLSEMDKIESKNFIFKGAIKTAKLMRGVKSEYRIEAEADVRGTALNPFDTRQLMVSS